MQITDPIADLLTRIRNASTAKHPSVDVPASNLKKAICQILVDEGYIKGMKVNGKTYTRNFLTHEQLLGGAKIQYQMSDTPNKQRGTQDSDRPYSFSLE